MQNGNLPTTRNSSRRALFFDVLLAAVLILGAYLRFVGIDWGQFQHLHPDERFLTMVETGISPVKNLADYFNTAVSTLNPNNQGYGFFVYGDFPIILVRYIAGWLNQAGYDQVVLVGRVVSAIFDLLTVLMVYLVASRLYDRRVGVLAAAFSSFAVLQIQLSHYFTVDIFTNFFTFLAFYFAARVLTAQPRPGPQRVESLADPPPLEGEIVALEGEGPARAAPRSWSLTARLGDLFPYVFFGFALGMAVASKVSAAPLAVLLPLAAWIPLSKLNKEEQKKEWPLLLRNLVVAAVVSLVVFRIFQPYAFSGPGFFGIKLNPQWMSNMTELSNQSSGDIDAPFALQWARRPIWFAWQNMVLWGMGLPLGLLAWAGFLWMAWRSFKGEWRGHALIWFWTAIYFAWQSLNFTRAMRYQLLVYPTLAIIAAWAVIQLWDKGKSKAASAAIKSAAQRLGKWLQAGAVVIGGVAVLGTFAWAFAFTRIYTRPVTRVAASQWIYQNVLGAINLQVETSTGAQNDPLPINFGSPVGSGQDFVQTFRPQVDGELTEIDLTHAVDPTGASQAKTLTVSVSAANSGGTSWRAGDRHGRGGFLREERSLGGCLHHPAGAAYGGQGRRHVCFEFQRPGRTGHRQPVRAAYAKHPDRPGRVYPAAGLPGAERPGGAKLHPGFRPGGFRRRAPGGAAARGGSRRAAGPEDAAPDPLGRTAEPPGFRQLARQFRPRHGWAPELNT